MEPNSRLFLALWPELRVRNQFKRLRQQCTWPAAAALARPESMHLTLHFLGNVPDARIPLLKRQLNISFDPFELVFSAIKLWPNGIAVIEPESPSEHLFNLRTAIGLELQSVGLTTEDRPFRPHVTLARHAQGVAWPAQVQKQPVQWRVATYSLVKSQNIQAGKYQILHSYGR